MKLVFREHNPQLYGSGALLFEWRPGGSNIAIAGSSGVVRLFNRYSEVTEEFNINEEVTCMKWDPDGDVLAIANSRSSTLCSTNNIHTIDVSTGAKALPTVLCWAPKSSILLIGDNKGNFILFNYRLSRKLPVMGKHQKAIKSAAWNKEGTIFALASEDTSITLNNAEGETLSTFSWNGEISELQFTAFRSFASDREEDFISAIVGRNLIIVRLSDSGQPTNLQFQEGYGNLVRTVWFGNGRLLAGFDQGFLVCLSAERPAESISQELFSIKEYNASFASITVNELLGKMFSVGDNLLKGRDLTELGEISDMINVDSDDSGLVEVACSEDGSMAAVSARSGALCVYLTKLPMLAAASSTHIAVLASLTEISIYQDGNVQPTQSLNIKVEPSLVAVGAKHIAIVLNNKAWFYEIKRNGTSFLYEHDYMTTILKLKLNRDFVMARLDKRVHLHRIIRSQGNPPDSSDNSAGDDLLFPDLNETNPRDMILDADLSDKFFLYSTTSRFLNYYSLEHGRFVSDFKHSSEIRTLYCEPDGIRTIFHDDAHDLYIYSPADDQLCKIPSQGPFMSSHQQYGGCLWESFTVDKDTFLVHDQHTIFVFMHVRNSRKENSVNFISSVQIPFGNVPILLSKGIVHCHTQNGRVNTILLRSHKTETQFGGKLSQELNELLQQSLMLRRWGNAWKICEGLKDQSAWRKFAETVMLDSNIELAVRIYRHLGDVAMVWSLEELLNIEDQQADSLFSNSSQPKLALEMRRDVQHWERALELARSTAPEELPSIAKEYAIQLEFVGQHGEAFRYYEEALIPPSRGHGHILSEEQEEHNLVCSAGMALHMGDLKRGVEIAMKLPSRLAKRDCGIVLEQLRAGSVYEAGQFYDRAAAAYLKSRNLLKVHKLMEQVRSPKLLSQYGKFLEKDKNYERAFKAYQKAQDSENQIRLLLRYLNKVNEAVKLAQESKSVEGSKMVASYLSDLGQYEAAIEFLVLSHCYQEAFDMAKSSGQVLAYANALEVNLGAERKGDAVLGHYGQLSEQFQAEGDVLNGGKFAGMAQQYKKALSLLLSEQRREEEALGLAVEYVAKSEDKQLVEELVAHLMDERGGGAPKDPKFLFQLYVKLKMYSEAAKTALIISHEQQQQGFYKTAHDLLFGMCQTLRRERIRTPLDMENSLMLLHSYNLVKLLLKKGDNYAGGRLLCRVVANIGQFPAHAVQILTSAVITCTKGTITSFLIMKIRNSQPALKKSAFNFASQLMQPSFRQKIDDNYKKKIELVVRKFGQNAPDMEEHNTPCPFCAGPVREFALGCPNCQATIPFCIFTGRHIVKTDFAQCPHCRFPGSFSEFKKSADANCPMCYEKLNHQILPGSFDEFINEMHAVN
uniref:WD repeat-containing protein 19 n=1 Tax=Globodera rostochiensis TaxID=31243 RepID=A0A914HUV5_GLORO